MKTITLIFIALFLLSCEEQKSNTVVEQPLELTKDSENYYNRVMEYNYEGCEYIRVGYGQSTWGSHKGNCSNPIHKNGR